MGVLACDRRQHGGLTAGDQALGILDFPASRLLGIYGLLALQTDYLLPLCRREIPKRCCQSLCIRTLVLVAHLGDIGSVVPV